MTRLLPDFEEKLRASVASEINLTIADDAHGVGVAWCELADRADLMSVAFYLKTLGARLAMITASQPPAPEEEDEDDDDEEEEGEENAPVAEIPLTFGGTRRDGTSYEVVYHFIVASDTVNLIAHVPAGGSLPSLTDMFRPANWPEREIMEIYGLTFTDHPDPRRLFLDSSIEPSVLERLIPFSTLVNAASTDELWQKVHAAAKVGEQ